MNLKRTLVGALMFSLGVSLVAEAQTIAIKKANNHYQNQEYPNAVRAYEEVLKQKLSPQERQQALSELAFSYKKLNDYKNAERAYKALFDEFESKLEPQEYLHYAQVLAGNAKYRESQKMFSKYGEYQKDDMRGGRFAIAYMDNSHFFKDSAMYQIEYMSKLNTKYSDFAPMYYESGLVFVAARNEGTLIKRIFNQDETPFLDLYLYPDSSLTFIPDINDLGENTWAEMGYSNLNQRFLSTKKTTNDDLNNGIEVEEFDKRINSKYHEGPVTFSRDFKQIIFTRNNYYNGKVRKSDKGINMLKLYSAEKKGKKWTNIKELPFNSNNYSTGHPAFSPENHRLYFVSDMPGGYGGTDIYKVDYINGEWGKPVNLGPEVNTEGNEMFPFADQYGNLYFASDGHAGLGGLDIFYVEMRNGIPFGEVENLGYPINSEKDDFALITDGRRQHGYFSSNRKRGYSDDNIYSFSRGCNKLNIKIYDNDTQQPIAFAEVRLVKNEVNRELFISNEEGDATLCLEPGSDFYFKIFKEGYESANVTYGTLSSSLSRNQTIRVYLDRTSIPMVKGRVISEFDESPIVAAQVILENLEDGSTETVITGLDGRYTFQPIKMGKYVVKTVKENAVAATQKVDLAQPAEEKAVGMLALDDQIELKNIYYDYGKFEIKEHGKKELREKILPLLKKYPDIKIELRSHTDSKSSAEFNMRLSQKRAENAKQYLISLGVKPQQIIARGYGKTDLANECDENTPCAPERHAENRRTEIRILNVQNMVSR